MIGDGPARRRDAGDGGDAAQDHRRTEEELTWRWLRQTLAVMALNIRTIPSRLSSSGVAIVGIAGVVVVFVSVLSIAAGFGAAMQGSGAPRSRAGDAERRRQRDDERRLGRRGRHHQAGARHPARRSERRRVGRAVRHHRAAEEVGARLVGERPDARHRAGGAFRCARKCRSSPGGCSSSAPTRSSSGAARADSSCT